MGGLEAIDTCDVELLEADSFEEDECARSEGEDG